MELLHQRVRHFGETHPAWLSARLGGQFIPGMDQISMFCKRQRIV
jgi:hypothetical protein